MLQNFISKRNILDKFFKIQNSKCNNIIKYISCIKNKSAKIKDLKISNFNAVVIYTFNNLNSHF